MATLTAGDVFGIYTGYHSSFGAGSLSPNTFDGKTCRAMFVVNSSPGRIVGEFFGDETAYLSGKQLFVNGTGYNIVSGPTYNSGDGATTVEWLYGPGNFTVGNNYTVDVGAGGPPPDPFLGPTFVGKSTAAGSASATSVNFGSSGRLEGDKLYIAVATANQAMAAPSGWGEVATYSPQSRGTAGAAGGLRLTLFEKVSDGTEGVVSIADSGDHQYAVGIVVRKASGSAVALEAGDGNNVAASTSCTFGGVTTGVSDCLIVTFVATDRDSAGPSFSGESNGNLVNLTERHDAGTTAGSGGGIAVYTGEKQAAGATGNTTATQAANSAYCWITLALKNGEAPAATPYAFGFVA